MFIRIKKSMSLQMTCQKSRGKKSRSLVRGPRSAVVDPDFYSSAIEVDNYDQDQDGCKLTDVFQADPVLQACATFKEMKKGCGKRSPTSALFTSTGSSDHHPYEEAVLINSALLFNQEVPGGPSPSHQLSGSEKAPRNVDWMEQAEYKRLFRGMRDRHHPIMGVIVQFLATKLRQFCVWRITQSRATNFCRQTILLCGGDENAPDGGRFQRGYQQCR